jgi:hypothetical protein
MPMCFKSCFISWEKGWLIPERINLKAINNRKILVELLWNNNCIGTLGLYRNGFEDLPLKSRREYVAMLHKKENPLAWIS